MRRFGLIGYPLSHSFSQNYFTKKFRQEEISDCVYENFPIDSFSKFPSLIKDHPDLEGFNITIPYKEDIIPLLDSASLVVQDIRACNCVRVRNGELHGFNTDVVGFKKSLQNFLNEPVGSALILGTGGSAKAVAYVLNQMHIRFSLVSRKPKSEDLGYEDLTEEILKEHRLIINTTPLGMYPVDAFPDIPYTLLTPKHYLFDLIYNPAETLFLKKGKERGAKVQNGQEMLEIQAEESWRIWNEI